ncbi:Hsp20/alpha crystallin family protein [Streptomyces sp. cf386]|uniref:Hsp20/alpha crystallin family protein n=1 Tax=Streptomyces sp. cf386 TaxID=1761904 RepID=UPI003526A7E3
MASTLPRTSRSPSRKACSHCGPSAPRRPRRSTTRSSATGTFTRSVRLPAGATGDEATADYKDGVLTITVPVPEAKAGTRTIPVRLV